ncbi:efflux RND transporter permease subunit [Gammaproteobacteria bacterium]|jgi:multidrug efflux pump|nr:efflux RND transporter permease subunit [Gammaproteobacteria bacterium]MDB4252946.1 efflux RND transporter permease subunit [Gammaproteobacteria bacterium]|tara:strand:+ start:168 stop:3299 length:3132 start_codon:yes stop_codon:yes gene_type:complete
MTGIIDFALSKAKTTLMIAVLIVIAGSYARQEIPIAASPNIQLPFVSVAVFLDGASPSDGSRLVAKPLENRLRTVPGVKTIRATSSLSNVRIFLEFEVGYDIDKAIVDTKQAVEEVKFNLPQEAEDPQINEYSNANFPVMNLSVIGASSLRQKVFYARELKDRLEKIEEVLETEVIGSPDEVLEGIINKSKMEAYGVTLTDLYYSVANNNVIIPGGKQDTGLGSFMIEVPSVIETAEDVYSIPIKVTKDAVVTLSDIASIRRTFKDFNSYARVNGEDAVAIEVMLREGANAIDAANKIAIELDEFRKILPENLTVVKTNDDTVWANMMVSELNGNIISAVVLIMILVVASMGFRVSMLVGLSIPFCFLLTYLTLYLLGYEVNFLVMMGLLLGMGMLIDGSIVVTEYADRKISEGLSRLEAYRLASKRMFTPVLASTATTIAAFIPLIFWPGFTGQFMRYLPITVSIVLASSLFYSLVLIPVLGSYFGQSSSTLKLGKDSDKTGEPLFDRLAEYYGKLTKLFVKNPGETIILTLAVLFTIVTTYNFYGKGTVYFAIVDPVKAEITVRGRGNFSALESKKIIEVVEERLLQIDELESVFLRSGSPWWERGGDKIGSGYVEVVEPSERDISGLEIMQLVTEVTQGIPGIIVEAVADLGGPQFDSPIELNITGDIESEVVAAALLAEEYMRNEVKGLTNIFSSQPYPSVEWNVQVDKQKAAQLGVKVGDVGALVQMLTSGFKVGEFRPDDSKDEVEIRVRFPSKDRTITGINTLNVTTANGLIPVSSFITLSPQENRSTVNRRNGQYVQELAAATIDESLVAAKVAEMQLWIEAQNFSKQGINMSFTGMQEETEEVNEFMVMAGITALFIMLILLLTQFNSFYQSFLILSAVFMSFVGVLLGLLISNRPFSSTMTGISIVTLAGIVVNNNIVLIDTFNRLKFESPETDRLELIRATCQQRLRPILLTSATTIFGLLPLAMGLSFDLIGREIAIGTRVVDWWQNLALSIVFGLGFSTLLTLIFTPAALAFPYKLRDKYGQRFAEKIKA